MKLGYIKKLFLSLKFCFVRTISWWTSQPSVLVSLPLGVPLIGLFLLLCPLSYVIFQSQEGGASGVSARDCTEHAVFLALEMWKPHDPTATVCFTGFYMQFLFKQHTQTCENYLFTPYLMLYVFAGKFVPCRIHVSHLNRTFVLFQHFPIRSSVSPVGHELTI